MERSYAWFLGANDLGVRIAHPGRGAGGDGLTPKGRNMNEGAESTLMWLMAAEHIRALRATKARVLVPLPPGRVAPFRVRADGRRPRRPRRTGRWLAGVPG